MKSTRDTWVASWSLGLAAALLLGACSGSSTDVAVGAPPPSAPAAPTSVSASAGLPVLPPLDQRQPHLFDERGCLVTSPSGGPATDACTTSMALDASEAGTAEGDWRILSGFTGRSFTTDLARDAIVVLEDSVTISTTGSTDVPGRWSASGLVRNERATAVPDLAVTATLLAADGTVLEAVTAESPVRNVRSGEPVPFRLVGRIADAAAVATVQWQAEAMPDPPEGKPPVAGRGYSTATFWTRPVGGRPVENDLHRDAGSADSHLVFGSITNVGDPTGGVDVHAAWVDTSGRVIAQASSAGLSPEGTPSTSLGSGASADFLLVVPGDVAASLADLIPMTWVVER